jgi:hypothetical protein
VDWEPDAQAGDCLLRVALLRQLIDLRAHVSSRYGDVTLDAPGRVVSALSDEHAAIVRRLGGSRRIALSIRLHFTDGAYVGGEETYALVDKGRPNPLLRLTAQITVRTPRTASPRTSPAPT